MKTDFTIPFTHSADLLRTISLDSNKSIKNSKKIPKKQPWYSGASKHLYTKIALWALGLSYRDEYKELANNLDKMFISQNKRKNLRMPFEYFKDCYTILQFRRAGKKYTALKHFVSIDKGGIPKIIPYSLRTKIAEDSRIDFIATCTILGIFRVIPGGPYVSYDTITDKFSGISKTLEEGIIIRGGRNVISYTDFNFQFPRKLNPPRFLDLRRSSPNGPISLFSSSIDVLGFGECPKLIIPFIKGNYNLKGGSVLINFIILLILTYPLYLICQSMVNGGIIFKLYKITKRYIINPYKKAFSQLFMNDYEFDFPVNYPNFGLGKLGLVKDQTGKSRIVGITNYGIQVSLKPVHDLILSILKKVPTDGTYDQLKPVLDLPLGEYYSSYDLSSATDRLPIDVQKQVLTQLIGEKLANLWGEMLDFPFNTEDDMSIEYEVGQPMGAYSSGAVMALTHHVIIASLFKPEEKPLYAVLGDDMCITPEKGAKYLEILEILGVSISLPKSLEGSLFIEFAKKLINKTNNQIDAILGPKLIMRATEDKYLRLNLLYESGVRELIDISNIFGYIEKVTHFTFPQKRNFSKYPKKSNYLMKKIIKSKKYLSEMNDFIDFGRFYLFGPSGLIIKNTHYALGRGCMSGLLLPFPRAFVSHSLTFDVYSEHGGLGGRRNKEKAISLLKNLLPWVSKRVNSPGPVLYPYTFILFLLSPGFLLPLQIFRRDAKSEDPVWKTSFEWGHSGVLGFKPSGSYSRDPVSLVMKKIEESPYSSIAFDLTIISEKKKAIEFWQRGSKAGETSLPHFSRYDEMNKNINTKLINSLGNPYLNTNKTYTVREFFVKMPKNNNQIKPKMLY